MLVGVPVLFLAVGCLAPFVLEGVLAQRAVSAERRGDTAAADRFAAEAYGFHVAAPRLFVMGLSGAIALPTFILIVRTMLAGVGE